MGKFSNEVRSGESPHPLTRGFNRVAWNKATCDDLDDENLKEAGLAVADLVEALRPHALLKTSDRQMLQALVALANNESKDTHVHIAHRALQNPEDFHLDRLLQQVHAESKGTLTELSDALGDSLVFPLREAMRKKAHPLASHAAAKDDWLSKTQVAREQGVLANRWYLAWFFWMDVLWCGARLIKEQPHEWHLIPDALEKTRQIGMWRRQKRVETFLITQSRPTVLPSRPLITCGYKLTRDGLVLFTRTVRRKAELSWPERINPYIGVVNDRWSPAVEKIVLNINGSQVTVREAMNFFASLEAMFFDLLEVIPLRAKASEMHPRDALCVSRENVCYVISELTNLPLGAASVLFDAATFYGRDNEAVWGKPFVFVDADRRFIFLVALKSNLLRTINELVDKYSANPSDKGGVFERHCRSEISRAAGAGPLSKNVWVTPRPVKSVAGDIDLCILLGANLIVAEVKFTGIPCDAFDYWRATETLAEAKLQLQKKIALVNGDVAAFSGLLAGEYGAPLDAIAQIRSVIPLIICSDEYHAGFPYEGVNVADIDILVTFLQNEFVSDLEMESNRARERIVKIYSSAADAAQLFPEYLAAPETIVRLKKQMKDREIIYPTDVWSEEKEIQVKVQSIGFAI
ncbi:MAG: hypothetical protein ACREUW_04895 [Burkholderiales bacterium]